jgi:hypothetical protein
MRRVTILIASLSLLATGAAFAQDHPGPMANPNASGTAAIKSPQDMKADAPVKGHNSFTMGQARKRIEKAGYTHVTGLKKDSDGIWQGHARQDGKKVYVAMDFQGNVTSK